MNKLSFRTEWRMVLRFVHSQSAFVSSLMSSKWNNKLELQQLSCVCLDSMVEFDKWLSGLRTEDCSSDEENCNERDDDKCSNKKQSGKRKRNKGKRGPQTRVCSNFTKSTSLSLMLAADLQEKFGPASLCWEGGFKGEKKSNQSKPCLPTKEVILNGKKSPC